MVYFKRAPNASLLNHDEGASAEYQLILGLWTLLLIRNYFRAKAFSLIFHRNQNCFKNVLLRTDLIVSISKYDLFLLLLVNST